MTETTPDPRLRALFTWDMPVAVRCHAILHGDAAGRVLADPADPPAWAVVQELADGTVYWGGAITPEQLQAALETLRRERAIVIGLWPGDPRRAWLPPAPGYVGAAIDFTKRTPAVSLEPFLPVPPEAELRAVDAALFDRLPGRDWTVAMIGSAERALAQGLGYALLVDGAVACEAFAGPRAGGVIEVGTGTAEAYQGRGYATLTCAHLLRACEARGDRPFWNASSDNAASLALARKLGFTAERPFDVFAWGRAA